MTVVQDVPWHEARARAAVLGRRLPAESIPLAAADRRTLAAAVAAFIDLPSFDSSAMDGWAVAGHPPWVIVGSVAAGDPSPPALTAGQAVRIATGAQVPHGATAILRTENGVIDADGLVTGPASPADMRRRGEECRQGDVLAKEGIVLTPPLVGLLAAAGHDAAAVTCAPRIRLVLMGDELQEAGLPGPGRVRDALGPQLPAWLQRVGAEVVDIRRLNDVREDVEAALSDDGVDLIISTGGTAAGPHDHVHTAVEAVGGHFVVDGVAVRPGHPMAMADMGTDHAPLVALPGNPQAAIIGLLTLAFPLIAAQLGRADVDDARVVLAESLNAPDGQTRMVGGVIAEDGFRRSTHAGSAMLRGLAASTGYAVVPPGGATPGDLVTWLPLA
jgi:molybdopterin molybdotransferase